MIEKMNRGKFASGDDEIVRNLRKWINDFYFDTDINRWVLKLKPNRHMESFDFSGCVRYLQIHVIRECYELVCDALGYDPEILRGKQRVNVQKSDAKMTAVIIIINKYPFIIRSRIAEFMNYRNHSSIHHAMSQQDVYEIKKVIEKVYKKYKFLDPEAKGELAEIF